MKDFSIIIEVKISDPTVHGHDPITDGERLRWEILNHEQIEKEIYQKFRTLIEREFGKTVLRSGSSELVQFPTSMVISK